MNPSTVCDCAGTSMSLEEQLKQPWAKNVKRPINVGDPSTYAPTINLIHFERDYVIRWSPQFAYEVWRGVTRIGCYIGIIDAVATVKLDSEARCLKDLQAARIAWEAEEKRKKAPETVSVSLTYRRALSGVYCLDRGSSNAVSTGLATHPKILAEMPTCFNGDALL